MTKHDAKTASNVERQAFSVGEFCLRNRISKTTYQKLRRDGRGPREMKLGGTLVRISVEAEQEWRTARERPSNAELRLLQREAEHRRRVNRRNGQRSAASPNHINKQRKRRSAK